MDATATQLYLHTTITGLTTGLTTTDCSVSSISLTNTYMYNEPVKSTQIVVGQSDKTQYKVKLNSIRI